jgi:hypothetical protein
MDNIEALALVIYNLAQDLASFDELDAVVVQVFDDLDDLRDRVAAIKNNLNIIDKTLSAAPRNE